VRFKQAPGPDFAQDPHRNRQKSVAFRRGHHYTLHSSRRIEKHTLLQKNYSDRGNEE